MFYASKRAIACPILISTHSRARAHEMELTEYILSQVYTSQHPTYLLCYTFFNFTIHLARQVERERERKPNLAFIA